MDPKPPHFPAKVKNIIYLFMAGGPSQLEMFDYKPKLQEYDGKPIPDSLVAGEGVRLLCAVFQGAPQGVGNKPGGKKYSPTRGRGWGPLAPTPPLPATIPL